MRQHKLNADYSSNDESKRSKKMPQIPTIKTSYKSAPNFWENLYVLRRTSQFDSRFHSKLVCLVFLLRYPTYHTMAQPASRFLVSNGSTKGAGCLGGLLKLIQTHFENISGRPYGDRDPNGVQQDQKNSQKKFYGRGLKRS